MEMKPLRFIGEPIQVQFDQKPRFEKKQGCPDQFVWRGETYRIIELISEWHDHSRKGRMLYTMRQQRIASATQRGSWGVGRDYYRIRTENGCVFDLYYDRNPEKSRKGAWFLYREMSMSL